MEKLLNNDEKKLLIKKSFKENEIIFHENDICESVGYVESGDILISSYLNNGTEIIYNKIRNGDFFGNNLIFTKSRKYKGNVVAKANSVIIFIREKDLVFLLMRNEAFLKFYLNKQSEFGKSLNSRVKLLSIKNAEERFLFYLQQNGNKFRFKSVTEIAKNLNLERETVSRIIYKLIRDKAIKLQNKVIIKI